MSRKRKILINLILLTGLIPILYVVFKEESVKVETKPEPEVKKVNVVRGIAPVWTLADGRREILNALAHIPAEQRDAYIKKHWPHLNCELVFWLKQRGSLKQDEVVSSIHYLFGSAKAYAEDVTGTIHQGYFEDELVAKITVEGRTEALLVAVRCLNGLFDLVGSLSEIQETAIPFQGTIYIRPGQGLCHHVDYKTAIQIAKKFNLPLYEGQRLIPSKRITPEKALELESMTDYIQVTVLIHAGDVFDFDNLTYNGQTAE